MKLDEAEQRHKVALWIVNAEARRDSLGRLVVYQLPAGDGGGKYEVAGINDGYHPHEASELAALIKAGRHKEAEERAAEYIASYTDTAGNWTANPAIQAFLRDCVFNRGARGAAKILQLALGTMADGIVGPRTRMVLAKTVASILLPRLRVSRETYERTVVGRNESSKFWKGLVNRWNAAEKMARTYL